MILKVFYQIKVVIKIIEKLKEVIQEKDNIIVYMFWLSGTWKT